MNDGINRLFMIFPLIEIFNNKTEKLFTLETSMCVDKSLPFSGRIFFRQYIPDKPHRYGIKLFKLYADSGYICGYIHIITQTMIVNSWVLYQKILGTIKLNTFKRHIFVKLLDLNHPVTHTAKKNLDLIEKQGSDVLDVTKSTLRMKTYLKTAAKKTKPMPTRCSKCFKPYCLVLILCTLNFLVNKFIVNKILFFDYFNLFLATKVYFNL